MGSAVEGDCRWIDRCGEADRHGSPDPGVPTGDVQLGRLRHRVPAARSAEHEMGRAVAPAAEPCDDEDRGVGVRLHAVEQVELTRLGRSERPHEARSVLERDGQVVGDEPALQAGHEQRGWREAPDSGHGGQEQRGGTHEPEHRPRAAAILPAMIGCLVAGLLAIFLFVIVPLPLWPLLIVALVVLVVVAAALGLFKGVFGAIFGRRQ